MKTVEPIYMGYCNKVLPLVYDDSLSYTEQVGKLVYKVNEVISAMEGLEKDILDQAKAYTDEQIAKTFEDVDLKIQQLENLIETTTEDFEQLVADTVRTFNSIVDDLQAQYQRFTQYVNGELTDVREDIADTNERLDASITAVNARTDLMIQLNNEYLLEEVTQNLPSIMKVLNILEGDYVTIQEMFDYLCNLHIVDGIIVSTLAARALTCNRIVAINRTVRDCVMYGNTILVP